MLGDREDVLIFGPSSACDRKCIFCETGSKYSFSTEEAKEFITSQKENGLKEIRFAGGEPLLRKDIYNLISFSKESGLRTSVITNGSSLNKILVEQLKSSGLDLVILSFFSHKKCIFDKMAGKTGAFEESINGLKSLSKAGIETFINIIITKQNYTELKSILSFLFNKFAYIKKYKFFFVKSTGRASGKNTIIPKYSDVAPFLEKALNYAYKKKKIAVATNIPYCCVSPSTAPFISFSLNRLVYKRRKEPIVATKLSYRKTEQCRDCYLSKKCNGVMRDYLDLYGSDEIKPIMGVLDGT